MYGDFSNSSVYIKFVVDLDALSKLYMYVDKIYFGIQNTTCRTLTAYYFLQHRKISFKLKNYPFSTINVLTSNVLGKKYIYLTALRSFFLFFPRLFITFLPGDMTGGGGGEGDFNSDTVWAVDNLGEIRKYTHK